MIRCAITSVTILNLLIGTQLYIITSIFFLWFWIYVHTIFYSDKVCWSLVSILNSYCWASERFNWLSTSRQVLHCVVFISVQKFLVGKRGIFTCIVWYWNFSEMYHIVLWQEVSGYSEYSMNQSTPLEGQYGFIM